MQGFLIVLEGIDGAGTTTQAALLRDALRARSREVHLTREPSDGPVGKILREFLSGKHKPVDSATLSLLFAADRADHLQREVEPHLSRGAVVISDRWYHSSLAYQGAEQDREWILTLNARARRPDLTILLDVDPEVAAARREADGRSEELFDHIETQKKVAAGYHAVVDRLRDRELISVIDGSRPVEDVAAEVLRLTLETCTASGGVSP